MPSILGNWNWCRGYLRRFCYKNCVCWREWRLYGFNFKSNKSKSMFTLIYLFYNNFTFIITTDRWIQRSFTLAVYILAWLWSASFSKSNVKFFGTRKKTASRYGSCIRWYMGGASTRATYCCPLQCGNWKDRFVICFNYQEINYSTWNFSLPLNVYSAFSVYVCSC